GIGRYGRSPTGKLVPEGVEGLVDYVGPVGEVLSDMVGGLKHAMGYAGFHSISEFRRNASLVEVSPGGQREAHPSVKISKEPRNYRRTFGEL
ncbi:MAG: IMP dehydrogenase, partial [Nitrososphaeria archaeon]|nr:IMP dehydrogenase [Nitrososphaeria archaeon]